MTDTNKTNPDKVDNLDQNTEDISMTGEIEAQPSSNFSDTSKESIQDLLGENQQLKSDLDKITRFSAAIKTEFDTAVRKFEIERKENKYLELSKIVAKFQKLLEGIRMFFLHLDDDLSKNEQIKGLKLTYEGFIAQELANMGVYPIVSLGLSPDTSLHEVLMVQDATDDDLNYLHTNNILLDGEKKKYNLGDLHGKIIKEFEVGYYYFDGEKKITIKPSKVVVAN